MTIPELGAVDALLVGWGVSALLMAVLWMVARARRDAGIVDVGWAGGLGLLALLHAAVSPGDPGRRLLVAAMGAVWGFRLAGFLAKRMRGQGEDPRYADLRARWGESADRWFLPFFQAQGALDVILSISFLVVAHNPRAGIGWSEAIGILVWIVAVGGESLADRQLSAFKADPANRGRTCRRGLWRWSRHPNYFFEWVHWLAYVPLAWGSSWWPATLLAPAIMLFLVTKVTGIPPTEAQSLRSRGADYEDYQRTTSAFFPWPPRRDPSMENGA
jgi:steroid 5-alpha reductase family enzyme